jgi:hypothetical protein
MRALPDPRGLARWYRRLRSDWWGRFAVSRFLADAASSAIVGHELDSNEALASFWESDVDYDPEHGAIFCRRDRRVHLLARLRFHAGGDQPAEAIARHQQHVRQGFAGRIASAQSRARAKPAAPSHAALAS